MQYSTASNAFNRARIGNMRQSLDMMAELLNLLLDLSKLERDLIKPEKRDFRIRELLEQRTPFYKQADVLVSAEGRPVREVAQHVANQFHVARRNRR